MGDIGKTDCPICKFFKYRKDFACSMDLKELNYIVVIADEGSISRVAATQAVADALCIVIIIPILRKVMRMVNEAEAEYRMQQKG